MPTDERSPQDPTTTTDDAALAAPDANAAADTDADAVADADVAEVPEAESQGETAEVLETESGEALEAVSEEALEAVAEEALEAEAEEALEAESEEALEAEAEKALEAESEEALEAEAEEVLDAAADEALASATEALRAVSEHTDIGTPELDDDDAAELADDDDLDEDELEEAELSAAAASTASVDPEDSEPVAAEPSLDHDGAPLVAQEDVDGEAEQAGEFEAAEEEDDDSAAPGFSDRPPLEVSPDELVRIIESLLFCADHPVTVQQLAAVFRRRGNQVRAKQVRAALTTLTEAYADPDRSVARGFMLEEIAEGYVFRTPAEHAWYVRRFLDEKPQRLSRAAMEALAVIAYRQPVTRPQIDEVRGVDSSSALRALAERRLVKILGKSEEVGRPLLYGTTGEFLEVFGLPSLGHLPTLQEFLELSDENQAKVDAVAPPDVKVSDLLTEDGRLVEEHTEELGESALVQLAEAVKDADSARQEVVKTLGPEQSAPEDPAPEPVDGEAQVTAEEGEEASAPEPQGQEQASGNAG